jgi:hypothetical protein
MYKIKKEERLMQYVIHQFDLDNVIVNGNFIDEDVARKHSNAMVLGKVSQEVYEEHYRKVAIIEANDLDHVFEVGNVGPEENITYLGKMHSVSVGDIIENLESGEKFVVKNLGFGEIE